MLEYYILSEFRSSSFPRVKRNTRVCSKTIGSFPVKQYAFVGKQIKHSVLAKLIFNKRKLSRASVTSGLSSLIDSKYLVFNFDPKVVPLDRIFELTEKGAYALNSGLLFKKAYEERSSDE